MASQLICPVGPEASARPLARYDIEDAFAVAWPAAGRTVEVWCPVIGDTPFQRVLALAVEAPRPWTLTRDRDHGNLILHARLRSPGSDEAAFRLGYTVERRALVHMLDPDCVRQLPTPDLFALSLRPERYVEVDEGTRALARDVTEGETNVLAQARAIYGYVTSTMRYDAAEQSWKGSTQHALTCSVGNCNDIHALFISLCRSVGIPARLVMGQALEPPPPGQEACDLCGYHCWAEFFATGLGWVPVDASCACKYGKGHLFGDLETNHIAWSVGRDVRLEPPQQGSPLLFFAAPYVEVDGQPHHGVRRGVRFSEA